MSDLAKYFRLSSGRFATLHEMKKLAKKAPEVYKALKMIRDHSALGRELYDWAKGIKLGFAAEKMDYLGLGGPSVSCNTRNSAVLNTGIVAHEIMHAVQYQEYNMNDSYVRGMDGRSRIIHRRGMEAGAVACQMQVLYEMKLNGFAQPWEDMQHNIYWTKNIRGEEVRALTAYRDLSTSFESGFKQAQREGKTTEEALKDGASAVHAAYHKSQPLRDAYNNIYLKDYLRSVLMFSGKGKVNPYIETDTVREMTRRPNGDYLVHDQVEIPLTDQELFGENKLMRQAFDYVETVKLQLVYGEKNYAYLRQRKMLEADNNPYRDLDPDSVASAIAKESRKKTGRKYPLEVMNDMAGIGNVIQLQIDFDEKAAKDYLRKTAHAKAVHGKAANSNTPPKPKKILLKKRRP